MDAGAVTDAHVNVASQGKGSAQQARAAIAGRRRRGFFVVRMALGVILLASAVLKFLSFEESPGVGLLSDPSWGMAALEIEMVLGLWLLAGLFPRALWWAASLWFIGLAAASSYLAAVGQPTCGCFGAKLPLNPWYAFGLDVAAVAALLLFRPSQVMRIAWADLRRLLLPAAGAGAILAASAAALTLAYGSLGEALVHLHGEAITVDPSISDMGDVQAPDMRPIPIRLVNHTDHPVRVIGGTADCSCVVWDNLPVVVPPRGGQSVTIRVAFRGSPRAVRHSFVLFTDDAAQSQVFGEVRGRVVSKGGS